jgi:hypothetical protein
MKIGTKKTYANVLSIPAGKLKGVQVRHIRKPAGTTMTSGNARTAIFGQQSEQILFPEPTVWHELSEKGRGVWMTDLPIEQRQTDELIARARGRVLVGGLGLGYAVVALAARTKVTEIVVVEQNAAIIKLVWDATIKRVRKNRSGVKLTVINADLFDYLKERQAAKKARPEFTWGLFDIWQGDGESTFHEVVVPLRALAHGVVASLVCWNEDIMRGQLRMGLDTRVMLLTMPKDRQASYGHQAPTLEQLTTETPDIYRQWAVPFWRWFKDNANEAGVFNEELVRFVMDQYVHNYGRPEAFNGLPALRPYRSKPVAVEVEAEA